MTMYLLYDHYRQGGTQLARSCKSLACVVLGAVRTNHYSKHGECPSKRVVASPNAAKPGLTCLAFTRVYVQTSQVSRVSCDCHLLVMQHTDANGQHLLAEYRHSVWRMIGFR